MPDILTPASGIPGGQSHRTRAPSVPPPPRRARGVACAVLLALAPIPAGCAPWSEPATFAVPSAAAARIRLICPPDTFIGTMTADCPRPLPRAAAPR